MRFTTDTLRSTGRKFEKALAERELGLSYQQGLSVWARITVGRNYSAASSQAKAQGHIPAGTITSQSICSALAEVGRSVEPSTAIKIFGEAIVDDLAAISYSSNLLLIWLLKLPSYSLLPVTGDKLTHLGLMDSDHAGYIAVSNIDLLRGHEDEFDWLRENANFAADLLNGLAGHSDQDCQEIFFANMRATFEQQDKAFNAFITSSGEAISDAISGQILSAIGSENLDSADTYGYDAIRSTVTCVIEDLIDDVDTQWLRLDCGLADAVIDHISGRIREGLQLIADGTLSEEYRSAPGQVIADSAMRAMHRFAREAA